ncbi:Gfo/Idh/MocA family oxidoreductase [Candidatus Thioglobus sp.]|nr:Gfo/Idh/MocA family oxidoreductase [Candidatus Thioglobus sp.]
MKALFVGLGSIGQRHLRNLKKLRPEIELLAVRYKRVSPVLDNTNNVVEGISISDHYNIKEFDSLSSALEENPDIVFITNPTIHHIEVAKKALLLGCFIFIEKPLSNDWSGIDELIEIEKKIGGKRISVGYQFRFHPALKLIKSLLAKKRIGNLTGVRIVNGEYMPNWHPYENYQLSYAVRKDLGGGAIVTQIHDFDLALWLFGKPTKLFSVGGHLSDLEIDVEDSVQILIKFMKNSKLFPLTINLDYLQWPPERSISITGDQGSIKCDLIKMEVLINERINDNIERKTFPDFNRNDLFIEEMTNFLAFFAGSEEPEVDLENATESLRFALAARDSMNSGKIINLL